MDFWIILTAFCVALSCATLGNILLLRGMSMLSDTISHAVLPGIVIGFLIAEHRNSLWVVFFAFVFGFLSTLLVQGLNRWVRLRADQSVGVTYIWLFSVGILLLSYFAGSVDLDVDHVLFGEIQYAFLPPYYHFLSWEVPEGFLPIFINLILVLTLFIYYFESLKIISFDPQFAKVRDLKTAFLNTLIMVLVALTAVTAFEHVGSIMVVGFFVIIPSIAFLWCSSLRTMFQMSFFLSAFVAISGYYWALWMDVSVTSTLMMAMSILFIFSLFYSFYSQKKLRNIFQKLFYEPEQTSQENSPSQ